MIVKSTLVSSKLKTIGELNTVLLISVWLIVHVKENGKPVKENGTVMISLLSLLNLSKLMIPTLMDKST
jgi:hypothetical protein